MKYFVTYGNESYRQSKKRILKEAEETEVFDCIKSFSPEDLPLQLTENPVFKCHRGGGYWIWKPYIIYQTLLQMQDNDILVYVDAGCSLYKDKEWEKYFSILEKYDMLTFLINCINNHYIRKSVIKKFENSNGKYWKYFYQLATTAIFLKKTPFTMQLIKEWGELVLFPHLVSDVMPQDIGKEDEAFVEHRHDQALFTALVYKYGYTKSIKMEWENFEKINKRQQAIRATRLCNNRNYKGVTALNIFRVYIKAILVLPFRKARQLFFKLINFSMI